MRRKGWRMSCDVAEVTLPTSRLILQPFRRFTYVTAHSPTPLCVTYVTAHSPTLPSLYVRHSSFPNPSFASPTSQALHLRHLASRPLRSQNKIPWRRSQAQLNGKIYCNRYSKYWAIFQHIHLRNWHICHTVGLTFVTCIIEVCRLGLEPLCDTHLMSCDRGDAREGWRMSCDVGDATEGLENELWRR